MALRDSVRSVLRYCASPSAARIGLAALRDRRIIERSPLFDAEWYMRENPDARRAGAIPAMHYLTAGFRAGLDPSPDFCGREYAALHGLAPDENPLAHYERRGRRRGLPTSFLEASGAAPVSREETLARIRAKAAAGGPLRAVFFVASAAMFPARPLLDAMLADPLFEPRIAVVPDLRWPGRDPAPDRIACERELARDYPEFLFLRVFRDRAGAWPDLLADADLAVYPSPYDLSDFRYNPRWSVGRPFLALHANYGFYRSLYDRDLMAKQNYAYFWKVFLECDATLAEYREHSALRGANAELTGYVKMDRLAAFEANRRPKARKTVLVAPHHSVEGGLNDVLALSTFERFADCFAELPARYPRLDFVFRPHPFLLDVLRRPSLWGPVRVDVWLRALRGRDNVRLSDGGDYFADFAEADAIVQDCGSWLVEWLYTGRPCCYLLKRPTDADTKFAPLGRECLKRCHLAYDPDGVDRFLRDVVLGGKDSKADARAAFRPSVMLNYPHAAAAALAAIKRDLLP